jgi:hypothetical protein
MAFEYYGLDVSAGETEGKYHSLVKAVSLNGRCRGWFYYEGTQDFGNAATGSGTFASLDVSVPGVALGDIVEGVSAGVDTVDAVIAGAVTAANTVTLTLLNNTAGAVNLASTTVRFSVRDMT